MTLTKTGAKTDTELQLDVLAEVNRDWRFRPAEIGVEVDQGIVTLVGTVSSYAKVDQAADVARHVPGVTDVANKLTVELPSGSKRDDTQIAGAVRDALVWDVEVPEERIDSIVRNGLVTLKGTVDSLYERKSAARAVANLAGVKGIDNQIVVVPARRGDQEIHDEIKSALRRRLPGYDLDVAVNDADVTLMGKVFAYSTRADADDIARGTGGVKSVRNKIVVEL